MSDGVDGVSSESGTGSGDSASDEDPQLVFLEELVEEHATIAGDVIKIDAHTWAIHGVIAVDGDVLMAEYDTEEHARLILRELSVQEVEPTSADGTQADAAQRDERAASPSATPGSETPRRVTQI